MNYEIKNSFIKAKIKLFGAELNSLQKIDEDLEYIWQGNPKYWARHSPVLFPIVGRLKDDSYFYKNKKYNLSQHGFARDKEFELIKKGEDFIEFSLKNDEETLKNYPFLFELNISYKLEKTKLIISYKVKNRSEDRLYFSIGAHPAFNISSGDFLDFEDVRTSKRYFLDDKGLIYKNEEVSFTKNSLILDEEIFKNDALVFNDKNIKSIILRDKNINKILKVEFKDLPYLGVWSKPNLAPFVCIEPWFGVADEENSNQNIEDKRGVQVLLKDELFSCFYSIEI